VRQAYKKTPNAASAKAFQELTLYGEISLGPDQKTAQPRKASQAVIHAGRET
jgi:hypothetical protein